MKRTLLLALLAFAQFGISQEQLENVGFENWEAVATPEEEPTEYSSLKTADQLAGSAPQVLWQSTDAHTGNYSARLKVAAYNIFAGVSPNGLLTNGQVHAEFNADNGYVFTNTAYDSLNTPCTHRPDSLVGWYKYSPQGGDKGKVHILLHDDTELGALPAQGGVTSHWVGEAKAEFLSAQTNWTRFSVPVNYYNNNYPDYILMVAAAGDSTQSVTDTELWIDDIELVYNPLEVTIAPAATQNIDINTDGNQLTATETTGADAINVTREWVYGTASGGPYSSFGTAQTGTTYTPNFATAGTYYVVCITDFGAQVDTSNEVQINVVDPNQNTVTVSPGVTQTLLGNTDGTMLTANETPSAASSREWKYSTTSGSGYMSFSPAETGTTYTPNFDALGTYYVICESDFSGDVQTSNEVTIIINGFASLDKEDLEITIFANESGVQLNQKGLSENAIFEVYTLDGKKITDSQVFSGSNTYSLSLNDGVYVYRIIDGSHIISGKFRK